MSAEVRVQQRLRAVAISYAVDSLGLRIAGARTYTLVRSKTKQAQYDLVQDLEMSLRIVVPEHAENCRAHMNMIAYRNALSYVTWKFGAAGPELSLLDTTNIAVADWTIFRAATTELPVTESNCVRMLAAYIKLLDRNCREH